MATGARPAPAANHIEKWLAAEAATHRPVTVRVAELLAAVRAGAQRVSGESWDQANERHAEEFVARLKSEFGARVVERDWPPPDAPSPAADRTPRVLVYRQKLQPMARRTTSFNYIFHVPGDSPEELVLVAHYDTWRGPGADDNTTGEEITKQYLMDDLRAAVRPPLTHTYILAGSEECGLIGFSSQVLLALGLALANFALTKGIYAMTALGLLLVPLAKFRFGVSGSREYVKALTPEQMARIKSVVSVDSVGEGRMYIPETSLGADFVRAFIPFHGYEALDDLLEEGAHLNGIKYNTFIAGGTTDHVSFLEVNSGLRDVLSDWLGAPGLLGAGKRGKRKIPASALVCLCPGKASPLVFGGKIHTPADTPDRVYAEPMGEALRILDYWYHLMQGGTRIAEPRLPDQYHYAQLFRVRLQDGREEHWLALKDALEPNRRNINGLYRVQAEFIGGRAICREPQILNWGVHTRLKHEVEEYAEKAGAKWEWLASRQIELETPGKMLHFGERPHAWMQAPARIVHTALGKLERLIGSNTFAAFFLTAYLLAKGVDLLLTFAFHHSMAFQEWFFHWFAITLPATVVIQIAVLMWLIGVRIPTMIDNNYRNLNKADNLRSLRRIAHLPQALGS